VLLFADTLIEDHDLYRFLAETVKYLGAEYVRIADGRTPFEVFVDEKFMGNSRIDPCSKILKRKILVDWLRKTYTPDEVEVHLGIDYSEAHRMVNVVARMKPYVYRSTLVEEGRMIPKDYSASLGIRPPRLYGLGLGHNNCGGFCVKAGLGHYAKLLQGDRDQYIRFEQLEQGVYDKVSNAIPFLKKQTNGAIRRITLQEYRNMLEEGTQLTDNEATSFGGCGCAI
jgi:hypothetical protein